MSHGHPPPRRTPAAPRARGTATPALSVRLLRGLLLALAACLPAAAVAAAEPAADYSAAERLLFLDAHLAAVQPPATLRYSFHRGGSLEPAFDDTVGISLAARPDGACCSAAGSFLSGAHRLALPDIDDARSNPVILYFLEHDVRDMQRLTGGQPAHFRKRIRLAIAAGAAPRPATFRYRGQAVAGREIAISPYLDDPSRARFERFARKHYVFMLSDAVPGGIYGIRSRIDGADPAAPLMVETLYIDGADAAAATSQPEELR